MPNALGTTGTQIDIDDVTFTAADMLLMADGFDLHAEMERWGRPITDDALAFSLNGPQTIITATATALENPMNRVLYLTPEMYGAAGVGNDDSAFFASMLADLAANPKIATVRLRATTYIVPAGITESIPGLRVIGSGHPDFGPSGVGSAGTWIQATGTGAWCWLHENAAPTLNDYNGVSFEGVGFWGDADTAGGLWVQSNGNDIARCKTFKHLTGIGFKFGHHEGELGTDDASWNNLSRCFSQDCLTGYKFGSTNAGSQVFGCETAKSTAQGIQGTGTGFHIAATNISMVCCKAEKDGTGYLVEAHSGVTLGQCRAEANGTSYHLNRGTGFSHNSRIALVGCGSSGATVKSLNIGPNQVGDRVVAFWNTDATRHNDGTDTYWVATDAVSSGAGNVLSNN